MERRAYGFEHGTRALTFYVEFVVILIHPPVFPLAIVRY